ncbi:Nucleotide-binding universal stress protein, UspA family [Noviherbaspirillum humi]|uniref:Nucleotide-binding universal stress protein, UspA family n=1 Tax=Noviherbaspirillum humi TaxID=1688639 RepID=A0A239DS32_9BURK|nr:universal stress protein [Noviherbaspirillum humi]SNS35009.1 Nucleotide-binding universal stress protein, UspA family [Noviherbaspirillum humi]
MYSKILVAYNGSPESRHALQECIRLNPGPAAEIHLLVVTTPQPVVIAADFAVAAFYNADQEKAERHAMELVLESGMTLLREAGLRVINHLEIGEPVDVISDMANRLGVELVIVGHSSRKPFAARWWRGSMDAMLMEKLRCSMLIASEPQSAARRG